jgi:zinc transport system substrate-binding protein
MLTKDKADIIILDTSGGCPHHHSAKPSDKSLIDNSEMVIYIDDQFDNLVSSMIVNYNGKKVKISDFSSIDFKGIDGEINWHFWLDLNNVKVLHNAIAKNIIQTFPEIKNEVTKNLEEALVIIDNLDKWKQSQLVDLAPVVLLSDSLEHFFKSINNSQIKKLDDVLSSDSIKCIVLDINQNGQSYSKYNKLIIQLDSENWSLVDKINVSGDLFVDQYSKMIGQVKSCK